ncbi:RNA recognition motif domain-containing protein [Endozoicomonadaceae bacterium StTr2]
MQQNKLFIGNLPFSVTEAELETAFGEYGELDEIKVITDRETGRSRGFAFVTFNTQHAAESALALDGQDMGGRQMRVNVATERPRHNNGGGGGRKPAGNKSYGNTGHRRY